jgi:hypothetical protein
MLCLSTNSYNLIFGAVSTLVSSYVKLSSTYNYYSYWIGLMAWATLGNIISTGVY